MRKLKLDPECLQVMSFETGVDGANKGTVEGHGDVTAATEDQNSCGYLPSCKAIWTCRLSCYGQAPNGCTGTEPTCEYNTCAACGSVGNTYCYCPD